MFWKLRVHIRFAKSFRSFNPSCLMECSGSIRPDSSDLSHQCFNPNYLMECSGSRFVTFNIYRRNGFQSQLFNGMLWKLSANGTGTLMISSFNPNCLMECSGRNHPDLGSFTFATFQSQLFDGMLWKRVFLIKKHFTCQFRSQLFNGMLWKGGLHQNRRCANRVSILVV